MRTGASDVREAAQRELAECRSRKKQPRDACGALCLVSGVIQLSENQAAEAQATLESCVLPPVLQPSWHFYSGEAHYFSGDVPHALDAWRRARKRAPKWLVTRLDARTGEALLWRGDARGAIPFFDRALKAAITPELLSQRSLAFALAGQATQALTDARSMLLNWPNHPNAELANRALALTGASMTWTDDERLIRAKAFLDQRDDAAAKRELELVVASSPRRAAAALMLAQLASARKDEAGFTAAIDEALSGPPNVAADAQFQKARRAMRVGDNTTARTLFTGLATTFPTEPPAEEARYLAAWIAMRAGDSVSAVNEFEGFEKAFPRSRRRDEARWFRGFAWYLAARFDDARKVFESFAADFPTSSLGPQVRYWAIRSAEKAGAPPGEINAAYAALVTSARGTLYALLARERLLEAGVEPPALFVAGPPTSPPKKKVPAQFTLASALLAAGLYRDAAEELASVVASIRTADDALLVGPRLQALGEFGVAHQLAARFLWGAVYAQAEPGAVGLMYPTAFEAEVREGATRNGVPPAVVWAIMRRESAFRPDVKSAADARGLLQIIPPTARSIAEVLGVAAPDPDQLYGPSLNIQFGTWYLGRLLDRFHALPAAAAAYNAGPGAVSRWIEAGRPTDEWIEQIPYKETRGYVKQVVADAALYDVLLNGAKAEFRLALTMPLPAAEGVSF